MGTLFDGITADTLPNCGVHLFCPAKLNLFLHITGRRSDGYHTLQSVFTCLNIGDTLSFAPQTSKKVVTLTGADGLTDTPDDNLIIKAAHALRQHADTLDISITPVAIHLTKHLPTGAGLGGGSSNAAMTLLGLNQLWGLGLDNSTLQTIGKRLGADVAFFVAGMPSAIVEGIGEKLTPIALPSARYLLLFPAAHNNTGAFFRHSALKKDTPALPHHLINKMAKTAFATLTPPFYNAFEPIACQTPAINTALDYLKTLSEKTHTSARLTGTGSCVFLPIPHTINQSTLDYWLHNAPCTGHIAQNHSPL